VRFVIRMIAERKDTSRDTEYTDWPALDRFVDELVPSFAAA
jgi:menaquinone-dependent protoporphyrinogen IX oxidase